MGKPAFLSLFSGCGGMDLGLERAGFRCVGQVEIVPERRAMLSRHWPDVPRWDDVRTFHGGLLRERPDLIAGGFPCQDISWAGTGAGIDGERSGLWREFYRLICEIRPRFALVENSAALLDRGLGRVLSDLAEAGYDAEWRVLAAGDFGAPHERERCFTLAYSNQGDGEAGLGNKPHGSQPIFAGSDPERLQVWLQAPTVTSRVDDGIPARLYRIRGEAIGDAVVPQVAEFIGRRILEVAQ